MTPPGLWPAERLEAEHIVLRRTRVADAEDIAQAVGESLDHLRPWMPWATAEAATAESQRHRIDQVEALGDARTDDIYVIRARADGVLVGTCGLHRRVGRGAIEIGYWVHAAHIRQGYATAAARALTEAAWTLADLDRVEIHCDQANVASQAIPRRLGYRLDRIEDDEIEAPGEVGRRMIWVRQRQSGR